MSESSVLVGKLFEKAREKSKEFDELIDKIETSSNETKQLWKDIYENALDDRVNAQLLFTDLYNHVANNQQGHMNHGLLMTKYLERMNKATDQLIKLAEAVEKAVQRENKIDGTALYEEFND